VAVGLVLLAFSLVSTWRAYRRARRQATELSDYAGKQALEIDKLASRLNEHGFALEHSASELFPRLQQLLSLLEQPLVAAAMPWLLRRAMRRPYRRR
jgi:hypothetical protein